MYLRPIKQSIVAALRAQFPTVTVYRVDEYIMLEPKAIRSPAIVVSVPHLGPAELELGTHAWEVHVQHYAIGAETTQRDYLLDALYRFWYYTSVPIYRVERNAVLGEHIGTLTDTEVITSLSVLLPEDTTVLYHIGSLYVRGLFYPVA